MNTRSIDLNIGEFRLNLTLIDVDCKQLCYGRHNVGESDFSVDIASVLFDFRDHDNQSLLTFLTNEIVSFRPHGSAQVRYDDRILTTIVNRISDVDSESLKSSFKEAGFDEHSTVLRNVRNGIGVLAKIGFYNQPFNNWLNELALSSPKIDTKTLLDTLVLKSISGGIYWQAGLPDLNEEFWLSSHTNEVGAAEYNFESQSGHTLCVSVEPRQPLGKVPLRDAFKITIDTASIGVNLDDSGRIISALKPYIIHSQIFPNVTPSLPKFNEHPHLTTGSENAWLFGNSHGLRGKLDRLESISSQIDANGQNSDLWGQREIIFGLTRQFQSVFGGLEYLHGSEGQISVRNEWSHPTFSGFHEVTGIVHHSMQTSLENPRSKKFQNELLLVFSTRNHRKLVVITTCEEVSNEYCIDWFLTFDEDLALGQGPCIGYINNETIERILKICNQN